MVSTGSLYRAVEDPKLLLENAQSVSSITMIAAVS